MTVPGHLLHVGYPKTGSKFLQRWFGAHPDLGFSDWGIAGFRDAHALMAAAARPLPPWYVTSHEALLTPLPDYEDFGAGGGAAVLPTRDAQRAACIRLTALFPASHVLIVTRGYETLIRSFYAEMVVGGASYGFGDFCQSLLAQVEGGTDVFDFDAAIDAYGARFGEERLLVLPFELLRDRPDEFLGAIEARLGIGRLRISGERVRPTPSDARLAAYRRMTGWMRAVPAPASLRRRYVAALRTGRLRGVAAAIEGRKGVPGGEALAVPPRLLDALAGRSGRLRDNPFVQDYAREYFL
ncbi:MAG TPA: hypothetical protein VF605_10120 [Allosphingosinicella sp.]